MVRVTFGTEKKKGTPFLTMECMHVNMLSSHGILLHTFAISYTQHFLPQQNISNATSLRLWFLKVIIIWKCIYRIVLNFRGAKRLRIGCLKHFAEINLADQGFLIATLIGHETMLLTPDLGFLFRYELCVWTSFCRLLELKHESHQRLDSPLRALPDPMKSNGTRKLCALKIWGNTVISSNLFKPPMLLFTMPAHLCSPSIFYNCLAVWS